MPRVLWKCSVSSACGQARAEAPRELRDLRRIRHAGGVAQRDAARAHVVDEARATSRSTSSRHVAFHRAAEAARQRHVDRHARATRQRQHVAPARRSDCSRVMRRLARLCVSLADITRLSSSACASMARSAPRTLGTSARVDHAGHAADLAQHDLGVAQRRNRLGRDEGGRLRSSPARHATARRPARSCRRSARTSSRSAGRRAVPTSCM